MSSDTLVMLPMVTLPGWASGHRVTDAAVKGQPGNARKERHTRAHTSEHMHPSAGCSCSCLFLSACACWSYVRMFPTGTALGCTAHNDKDGDRPQCELRPASALQRCASSVESRCALPVSVCRRTCVHRSLYLGPSASIHRVGWQQHWVASSQVHSMPPRDLWASALKPALPVSTNARTAPRTQR